MAANASVIEKPARSKPQPRQHAGKFGTSEAKKRRQAAGIDPQSSQANTDRVPGINAAISAAAPEMPTRIRQDAAQAVATLTSASKALTVGLIDKINQGLKKTEGLREIINAVPDTARYLAALVRGKDVEGNVVIAPHSDRLTASRMILEYAGLSITAALDERDLSELSLEELNQRVMQADHEISARIAIPGESTEVGNAAPLPPESPIIDSPTPSDQRQAID